MADEKCPTCASPIRGGTCTNVECPSKRNTKRVKTNYEKHGNQGIRRKPR